MAVSSTITCPDCDHDFTINHALSCDDVEICSNCKGRITITLEWEESEEEETE